MKADSLFVFKQMTAKTRYALTAHEGADIPGFPAIGLRGKIKGIKYVVLRPTQRNRPGHRNFTHSISYGDNSMITGANFLPKTGGKAFGDFRNDGILIDLAPDNKELTLYFFRGLKQTVGLLYREWAFDGLIIDRPTMAAPVEKEPGQN
jgi:hypothetical protein